MGPFNDIAVETSGHVALVEIRKPPNNFFDIALAWIANWDFDDKGKRVHWSVRGVNYDAAFRNAVEGVMLALSGNGKP